MSINEFKEDLDKEIRECNEISSYARVQWNVQKCKYCKNILPYISTDTFCKRTTTGEFYLVTIFDFSNGIYIEGFDASKPDKECVIPLHVLDKDLENIYDKELFHNGKRHVDLRKKAINDIKFWNVPNRTNLNMKQVVIPGLKRFLQQRGT